jgi:hypothetical protein
MPNCRQGATALVALAAATLALSGPASSYDRAPVRVAGLTPDSWGFSISRGEAQLRSRYKGVLSNSCEGVIMIGHVSDSSFINGMARYWDKLACAGATRIGQQFTLILDAKSAHGWVIYRLKGVTITALQG